jgi:glyoxylase-like metal-dependent hydrolase (beta-lactamase superfamily II)
LTIHRLINRRMAIAEMGKAGLAIVVFGTAACSNGGADATTTTPGPTPTTTAGPSTSSTAPGSATTQGSTSTGGPTSTTGAAATSYQRVNLQFVSAYILYRGGEAALVDTGVGGSAAAIQFSLGEAGLAWDSIGHVILTHKHPDHVGSVDEVMSQANGATLYAGAADIPEIASNTAPQAVGDGDSVFGLEIIDSPGHTAGHISVLDAAAGILVTGDALNGTGGRVGPPDPGFSEDMTVAMQSVVKLGGFNYEVALFGHGEPLLEGASAAVAALPTS